jgi:hypothetical protein
MCIACFVISSDQTLESKTVERAFLAMNIVKNRFYITEWDISG